MADDKTFTKDELDAAVKKAVEAATGDVDGLKSKVEELIGDNKKLKADLRAKSEVTPEDVHAAEDRADKAEARLKELEKAAKDATAAAEKATKALEAEQGAARSYALEAELNGAIAEGNVVPSYVPALKALLASQAKADLVDGKYAVMIGDKPAREHVKTFLDSEDGKAFKAAPANSGGGANGGGKSEGAKTLTRTAFDALPPGEKVAFGKEGGRVVDAAS